MKDNSNHVLVVGVIALVLGIVIGAGTWPKLNSNAQKGASLEAQTNESNIKKEGIYTAEQIEAQKKLKTMVVFKNTPEEISAAFGIDSRNLKEKSISTNTMEEAFDQALGGGPNDLPYVGCATGVHSGPYYEWPNFSTYYAYYCNWGF